MGARLYVSNLPRSATQASLVSSFGKFGTVVTVTFDGDSTMSRRGAFIVMKSSAEAQRAIDGLNLANLDGRLVSVYRAVMKAQEKR